MKTKSVSRSSAWVLAAMIGIALAACEEDKQPEEVVSGPTAPLTVSSVISDPKVGEPGDTLVLTAVVTSSAPNEGDFPVMEWTANGGTFLEDNKQTVRWVSPDDPGVFTITAKATNHVNSASGSSTVYIGLGTEIISSLAGQVDLINNGPDFHYLLTFDVTRGVDSRQYVSGAASDPIPPLVPATGLQLNTTYSLDGTMNAFAADTTVFATVIRPRHIYVGNFAAGTYTRLTVDGAKPGLPDRNRFDMPAFSPNGQVVAYQRWAQDWNPPQGTDSFLVYIQDIVANKRTLVTAEYDFPRAFFPTFSTDGNWLVYVLDKARTGQWELYASPMTGNDVDGSIAASKRLTNTGGQIVAGAPRDLKRPPMTWNPVSPVLAIAAADNALHLIQMTPTGGNDIAVPKIIRALEVTWSADGSMLAACFTVTDDEQETFSRISTVTVDGVVTDRITGPKGDGFRDVAFSPDGNWILYRVTRGGGAWFNALDIGAGKLSAPVAVTAADLGGNAGAYRGFMSLAPRWTSGNLMIYPTFTPESGGTPAIHTRDLNGLVN
ncbi:MAG TPA: hypothetical protein VF247_09790 [Candidatus Krumholzibacteria bacterium]